MAHRLFPITEGAYLAPKEIVRRLRAEFDFVEADAEAGTEHIAGMLAQFQRMNAPPAVIEAHRAALGEAVRIVVSDREDYDDDYLVFTTWPNNDPLVGYSSRQHEDAAAPLLDRVCKILGYRAELV